MKKNIKLQLKRETIRTISGKQLTEVGGGLTGRVCSIVYACSGNTSDADSCLSNCTSNTTF